MDLHYLALLLLAIQGVLGAFDTLYHHELTVALPQKITARRELLIHAIRASIYSVMFIGLAYWSWQGAWSLILPALFVVELGLTLWDFVVEDKTRLLPASERITHTVLAINAGAFMALLLLVCVQWWSQDSAIVWTNYGWLSAFLALCGVGVGLSALRDAWAVRQLKRFAAHEAQKPAIHFAEQPQSVLVTGGTGFVGQVLIQHLLADGHQVIVLTRSPKQAAWLFAGKVLCIQKLDELAPRHPIDVVINLAGARILGLPWTKRRKATLQRSRVALTEHLLQALAQRPKPPHLLLSASAIGYYGIQPQGNQDYLDENSPPQAIFMSQLCQDWEQASTQALQQGMSVALMRFGLVIGRQGGAVPMMLLPVKLGVGGRMGSGQQFDDLIRGVAHVWQRSEQSQAATVTAYNFTAPGVVTQATFMQTAGELLKRPTFFPTPAFAVRTLLGEQADLLLEGQKVVPQALLASGFKFQYPQLKDALQAVIK